MSAVIHTVKRTKFIYDILPCCGYYTLISEQLSFPFKEKIFLFYLNCLQFYSKEPVQTRLTVFCTVVRCREDRLYYITMNIMDTLLRPRVMSWKYKQCRNQMFQQFESLIRNCLLQDEKCSSARCITGRICLLWILEKRFAFCSSIYDWSTQ